MKLLLAVLNIVNGVPWSPSRRGGAGLPNPLNIRLIIAVLFAGLLGIVAPASAQFAPTPGTQPTFCVQGPGDVQPYVFWNGISAFSMATCGQPIVYACDSTGGVDVACADMVSDTITGKIVSKTIGGVTCGLGGSVNCTAKIIYNQAPLNATCTVRGSLGTAGTCDAVQNTVANRYRLDGLSCSTIPPCYFASGASSGYVLNSSISLTQPFALVAAAFTVNTSSTETFLSVGNASIKFSTSSPGNVLTSCDSSGGSTAVNVYQNNAFAPTFVTDTIATCIGGSGTTWQNAFEGANLASGGSTSASGVPVIMAAGGSGVNFWAFGVTTANLAEFTAVDQGGFWPMYAIHDTHSISYGYTRFYSGLGDVAPFKAAWGMRAYSAAISNQPQGQNLVNACAADNTQCSDIMSQPRSGVTLNRAVGNGPEGIGNASCWIPISSAGSAYNSTTGVTVLAVDPPPIDLPGSIPTGLAATNNFAISQLAGTGSVASLSGGWTVTSVTNTGGGDTATITFTGPSGLTLTITGGVVSTCTIKTFYDICTVGGMPCNYCSGGVPCDLTQTTVGQRAILTNSCPDAPFPGYVPFFYRNYCATFMSGQSQTYVGPGTATTAEPFSVVWAASRTGGFTTQEVVIDCNCASGFPTTTASVFMFDGTSTSAIGAASNSAFHSVVGESDSSNTHVYVDGVLAGTTAGSGGSMAQPYTLGSRSGGQFLQGQFFEGGIIDRDVTALAPIISAQQKLIWPFP